MDTVNRRRLDDGRRQPQPNAAATRSVSTPGIGGVRSQRSTSAVGSRRRASRRAPIAESGALNRSRIRCVAADGSLEQWSSGVVMVRSEGAEVAQLCEPDARGIARELSRAFGAAGHCCGRCRSLIHHNGGGEAGRRHDQRSGSRAAGTHRYRAFQVSRGAGISSRLIPRRSSHVRAGEATMRAWTASQEAQRSTMPGARR